MVVDAQEATRALADIEAVKGRMSALKYYRNAGPYFILWGCVWLIGDGAIEFTSAAIANWIWLGLIILGVAGSVLIGARQGARSKRESPAAAKAGDRIWVRSMLIAVLVFAFIWTTMAIFGGATGRQFTAFISITIGFVYMATGLAAWAWRVFFLGAVVAGLTMIGYLWLAAHFFLWMSLVGGGALIVGGLLIRKA
jgi:hypothetical protein